MLSYKTFENSYILLDIHTRTHTHTQPSLRKRFPLFQSVWRQNNFIIFIYDCNESHLSCALVRDVRNVSHICSCQKQSDTGNSNMSRMLQHYFVQPGVVIFFFRDHIFLSYIYIGIHIGAIVVNVFIHMCVRVFFFCSQF